MSYTTGDIVKLKNSNREYVIIGIVEEDITINNKGKKNLVASKGEYKIRLRDGKNLSGCEYAPEGWLTKK